MSTMLHARLKLHPAHSLNMTVRQAALSFFLLLTATLFASAANCHAQTPSVSATQTPKTAMRASKLPAPEKIIADFLKASGGKKRLAAIKDATYEWTMQDSQYGAEARARTLLKFPTSGRTDIIAPGGEYSAAATSRAAWRRTPDSPVQTLTGAEAFTSKLGATLLATRFVDIKKSNILANTVGIEQVANGETENETAYVVEFSRREGGRVRCWFGMTSKLLLQVADVSRGILIHYSDWRSESGILEPHRVVQETGGQRVATLVMGSARYNVSLSDAAFDPPGDAALDIPALLRELSRNQYDVDRRINDYTFMRKVTERKLNDKGEVTKEIIKVHEIYPVAGWGRVEKLISENGVALTGERAEKEAKRAGEELAKAERELPKFEEKRERKRAERAAKKQKDAATDGDAVDDDDVEISTVLRAAELVSPRRERFQERDAIVFDFRGRPGFHPATRAESIVTKLVGTMWIDPSDKQVMRLEARFVEGYKVGGGLVATLKPGAAFIFEQTRLPDGVWLPRFGQVNASVRVLLLGGITINETHEYSDFKRFNSKTGDATLDTPKPEKQ